MTILIIGSGPTGLGAAYHLEACGFHDWLLIEASSYPGGLATSFVDDNGFTWDIGGHVQFSHYQYFDKAMISFLGEDGWLHHQRESWVWIRDRFVPYPFQNNIHHLPPEVLDKCIQGLLDIYANPASKPANFQDWIYATFGSGLADTFMVPYNLKVWAHPLDLMNTEWVGERVSVVNLGRILKNLIYNQDDLCWGPNNTFQFPKRGGTGAIWKACAKQLPSNKIHTNTNVVHVDLKAKTCTSDSGFSFNYEHLISTMPLRELIKVSDQASKLMPSADKGLLFSSSNIVGL